MIGFFLTTLTVGVAAGVAVASIVGLALGVGVAVALGVGGGVGVSTYFSSKVPRRSVKPVAGPVPIWKGLVQ